jgi:hypothetical protein
MNKSVPVNRLLEVQFCDGGVYTEYYSANRIFSNGSYCSDLLLNQNVTVIAKASCLTWYLGTKNALSLTDLFCRFRRIEIQSPGAFYSAPLRDVLVFICKNEPKPDDFKQFDNFTADKVANWKSSSKKQHTLIF